MINRQISKAFKSVTKTFLRVFFVSLLLQLVQNNFLVINSFGDISVVPGGGTGGANINAPFGITSNRDRSSQQAQNRHKRKRIFIENLPHSPEGKIKLYWELARQRERALLETRKARGTAKAREWQKKRVELDRQKGYIATALRRQGYRVCARKAISKKKCFQIGQWYNARARVAKDRCAQYTHHHSQKNKIKLYWELVEQRKRALLETRKARENGQGQGVAKKEG